MQSVEIDENEVAEDIEYLEDDQDKDEEYLDNFAQSMPA